MTAREINARETYLKSIPMGPERWKGDLDLRDHKASCPEYRHQSQAVSFVEWMNAIAEESKQTAASWDDDKIRASYYERQPSSWVEFYDGGYSPADAIAEDMTCWG